MGERIQGEEVTAPYLTLENVRKIVPGLKARAKVLSSVRATFDSFGYLEVETPCGIIAPAAEEYIEAPAAGDFFLRTSPELQMKRLLAAGMDKIYQIGPCFREGEMGPRHRSEFTMLEYYETHIDYLTLLERTLAVVRNAALALHNELLLTFPDGRKIDLEKCEIIPVREAFARAGEDADKCAEEEGLFELVLVDKVEPALPADRLSVLIDYPIRFGAFARAKGSDSTLAERWELYGHGLELANAYGELIDPVIQKERFKAFARTRKEQNLREYPEPVAFLEAIESGIPEAAGAAMGFDRLVMLLTGTKNIGLVSFPLDS